MARPPKLSPDQQCRLRDRALSTPRLTTGELVDWRARELRVMVSASTIYRALPAMGLTLQANCRWREAAQ